MELYHKVFKCNDDFSIYLANPEPLVAEVENMLNRLKKSKNMDDLHEAKCSILKDFRAICSFDTEDSELPEPMGVFEKDEEKKDFKKKRILLQDIVLYLGSLSKKYHSLIFQRSQSLPLIQWKKLAIDYSELYQKAMDNYTTAIVNKQAHAITASFVLPSLIEQSLVMNLQNRMLFQSLLLLPDDSIFHHTLSDEEKQYISVFQHNRDGFVFNTSEKHVMSTMYKLFIRKGVLEKSMENEMVLTGTGRDGKRTMTRTLGSVLKSRFAKQSIIPEYMDIMTDIFVRLNIRNCIMHGLGESFDYLNLGLVAIMFQLLWDIAACDVFQD